MPSPLIDTKPFIGKTFWVGYSAIQVCPEPAVSPQKMPANCFYYERGKQFKVEQEAWNPKEGYMSLRVVLPDSRTGYVTLSDVRSARSEEQKKRQDDEAAECKRKGGIRIGMTKAQALASCFGKPERVNNTITSAGTHEQWVYGNGTYVYFVNGVVTSAQQTTTQ